MAQIAANPWSFTTSDAATSTSISSIVSKGHSALVTTSTSHGLSAYNAIAIQAPSVAGYAGGFKVASVLSATTFLIRGDFAGLASAGASGNVLTAAYLPRLRIEQALWCNPGANATVLVTDCYGNQLYSNTTVASTGADQVFTSGKLFWTGLGLVINTLSSGTLQLTIN